MDMETYNQKEKDLAAAERLFAAERARLEGTRGYSVDEFHANMRDAILGVAKMTVKDNR